MTAPRPVPAWAKPVLEYGPLLLFFAVFMLMRGRTVELWGQPYQGFIIATLVFVPVLVISTLILWRITGRLSPMQIATLVLVVVFGGLSVWLNDPRFFKMKPTLVYLLFAGLLGFSLLTGRNWLQTVMEGAMPMRPSGWRILTMRLTVMFLILAALNEIIWRTQSEETWVWFKTFGLTGLLFVFILLNAGLFRDHAPDGDDPRD